MNKRSVEVFSLGCPACAEAVEVIKSLACDSCDVAVHDVRTPEILNRAVELGVRSFPAVLVDGKLLSCCEAPTPDADALRAAGIGTPI